MMKAIFSIVTILMLIGCTSPLNTQPTYHRYLMKFNAQQPHKTHVLTRADGYRIQVREFGVTHRGRTSSIVMMQRFPDSEHLYDAWVPELSGQFHVVTFDFLGSWDSDKPVQNIYNVASQRTDLETVAAQLGLKDIVPVVHDLSGQAGTDWALDNEVQATALVLLNTYYLPMPTLC